MNDHILQHVCIGICVVEDPPPHNLAYLIVIIFNLLLNKKQQFPFT